MRSLSPSFVALALALAGAVRAAPFRARAEGDPMGVQDGGEATFYTPGLGACGQTNSESDLMAAVSHAFFDTFPGSTANPNANPLCGQIATVTYQGKTVDVALLDRCESCAYVDLDLSPAAFQQLGSFDAGRLHGISWQIKNGDSAPSTPPPPPPPPSTTPPPPPPPSTSSDPPPPMTTSSTESTTTTAPPSEPSDDPCPGEEDPTTTTSAPEPTPTDDPCPGEEDPTTTSDPEPSPTDDPCPGEDPSESETPVPTPTDDPCPGEEPTPTDDPCEEDPSATASDPESAPTDAPVNGSGSCTDNFDASKVYVGGDSAVYQGHNWKAKWWTQGPAPGADMVWEDAGAC